MTDLTDTSLDTPPYAPEPGGSGRSSGRVAAILVGVVALLGGTFAAVMIATDGGARGPVGAVEAMFDAIADEDLIGVLESLDPWERAPLQRGIEDLTEELKRVGVLSDDLDLRGVSGADIEFSGFEYETLSLTDDHVAVTVTAGTATITTDPAEAPLGDALGEMGLEQAEPITETETLDEPFTLVAVRRDGGWHVSIGWSILNAVRETDGFELRPPAEWFEPTGAESPTAVVEAMAAAITDIDFTAMLAQLTPEELEPLHAWLPTTMDQVDAAEAEAAGAGVTVRIDDLQLSEERDGRFARVLVDTLDATATTPDGQIRVRWDGRCSSYEFSPAPGYEPPDFGGPEMFNQSSCIDDENAQAVLPFLDPSAMVGVLGVTVIEVDGQWYVSPVATLFDAVVGFLRGIEDDGIDSLFEYFGQFLMGSFAAEPSQATFEEYGGTISPESATLNECDQAFEAALDEWFASEGDDPAPDYAQYCGDTGGAGFEQPQMIPVEPGSGGVFEEPPPIEP